MTLQHTTRKIKHNERNQLINVSTISQIFELKLTDLTLSKMFHWNVIEDIQSQSQFLDHLFSLT